MRAMLKKSCLLIAVLFIFVGGLSYSQQLDGAASIEKIECLDDMSQGVIDFRQKSHIYEGYLGYVEYDYIIRAKWKKNKKTNEYKVHDLESNLKKNGHGEIKITLKNKAIGDSAESMINNKDFKDKDYNLKSSDELYSMIEAHEKKHMEDIRRYPWIVWKLQYYVSKGSPLIKVAEEKRIELLCVMEARAVAEEIAVYKNILKKRRVKNAEEHEKKIVYALLGNAKIVGTDMTYIEAYKKYEKYKNSDFRKLANAYKEELEKVVADIINKGIASKNKEYSVKSKANLVLHEASETGRPVCRPCMLRDTIGKCQFWWCGNSGEYHSKYKRNPDDYVPKNYAKPFKR